MSRYLSSRPDDGEDDDKIVLDDLDFEELQLISAFLWSTKLGRGVSPYRDAAFTLMTKIEDMMGQDFIQESSEDVDLQIAIVDSAGNQIDRVSATNVEFEV